MHICCLHRLVQRAVRRGQIRIQSTQEYRLIALEYTTITLEPNMGAVLKFSLPNCDLARELAGTMDNDAPDGRPFRPNSKSRLGPS